VPSKEKLGKAAGINVAAAAAVVIEAGQAAGELEALVNKINEIRAKHGLNAIPARR